MFLTLQSLTAVLKDNRIIVPFRILWKLIKPEHDKTHWGTEALYNSLIKQIVARNFYQTLKTIVSRCEVCLKNFVAIEFHFRDPPNTPFLPWGDSDCEEKHP